LVRKEARRTNAITRSVPKLKIFSPPFKVINFSSHQEKILFRDESRWSPQPHMLRALKVRSD
jgi:hypothetical protein